MAIEKGNKVTLEYEGRFENGEVFDSSEKAGKPLIVIAGVGMVVKGFDDALMSMEKGEEKEFELEPEDGYGQYNEELKRQIPREVLPKEQEPQSGMILGMQTPDGNMIPARIIDVDDSFILIDINHPLAGKKLFFKIKIIDIDSNTEDLGKKDNKKGSVEDII